MIPFLRKYPLVKVIILNVLAVLAYDTLRQPPARAALLTAARAPATTPAANLGAAEPQLAQLLVF